MQIEEYFDEIAQDIEGAIVREGSELKIYVVQTRDQIH